MVEVCFSPLLGPVGPVKFFFLSTVHPETTGKRPREVGLSLG